MPCSNALDRRSDAAPKSSCILKGASPQLPLDKACPAHFGMDSQADGTALGEICECKKGESFAAWRQGCALARENWLTP
jgi:hypothetical protein